ncbi:MAG: hypothetical protein K1W22_05360 [Lachnospiraceae bacterium]
MVNLSGRLEQMKRMVDKGNYFVINRARQYGKTTMLAARAFTTCFLDEFQASALSEDFAQVINELERMLEDRNKPCE